MYEKKNPKELIEVDRTKILTQHEVDGFLITLYGEEEPFQSAFSSRKDEEGVILISIKLSTEKNISPSPLTLEWEQTAAGAHLIWYPGVYADRSIPPEWRPAIARCNNTTNMPLISLFSAAGRNTTTFTFSDVMNTTILTAGYVEEKAVLKCSVELFSESVVLLKEYEGILRIDTRQIPWFRAIADAGVWLESVGNYKPASVPAHALSPVYSTWYSFHQELSESELEVQSRIAKDFGFETLIVDDGWQTEDIGRGYSFCGVHRFDVPPAGLALLLNK